MVLRPYSVTDKNRHNNMTAFCLVLPFIALFSGVVCTTIDSKITHRNSTDTAISQELHKSSKHEDTITLLAADSELSASERTRRLIPYMAFYVPVQELPINKQYASSVQTTKNVARPSATLASGPHNSLPPQYVHTHLPYHSGPGSGNAGTPYLQSTADAPHYQTSAGDVYHSLQYGSGPHQQQQQQYQRLPSAIKQIDNSNQKHPELNVLSSEPQGPLSPNPLNSAGGKLYSIRHKTVQHFPPLPSQTVPPSAYEVVSSVNQETQQQQQHQQQHLQRGTAYRSRTKQSKINLTPFTPSNSVPGNFVPIVYTPVNNNNNKNNIIITSSQAKATNFNGAEDGKEHQIAIDYSTTLATLVDDVAPQHHRHTQLPSQEQQQQQHHHYNPKQQGQYLSVALTSLPTSGASSSQSHHAQAVSPPSIYQQQQQQPQQYHHQQQHHHHHHHHPEHVPIDAPLHSQQLTLIGSKHKQTEQQYRPKITHFIHPLKPENVFDTEQQLTPQNPYNHVEQQRPRFNGKPAYGHTVTPTLSNDEEQHQQYLSKPGYREQPAHILVVNSTAAAHGGPKTALTPTQPNQNHHYSLQNSHQSYQRPELGPSPQSSHQGSHTNEAGSSLSQSQIQYGEQILTIPIRSLFSDLRDYQHNRYSSSPSLQPSSSSSSSHSSHYPRINGPSTPKYIDYSVNEPQQTLEDDYHNVPYQHHNQQSIQPTLGPPSHAFILVTTAAPYRSQPIPQENYGSTVRPFYKTKPNVRLQPVTNGKDDYYSGIRQSNPKSTPLVSFTPTPNSLISDSAPKYVYVKEEFGKKFTTPSIKLKPPNKYETEKQIPSPSNPQQPQHLLARPSTAAVDKGPNETPSSKASTKQRQPHPTNILTDPNELPDIRTASLAEILHKLQESNHLPHTLTADNIDNSIKTLIRILNHLKKTQTIVENPRQNHESPPPSSPDYEYSTGSEEEQEPNPESLHDLSLLAPATGPNKHPGPSTGRPGIDYPNYSKIPQTSFDCTQQRYKGFFGDPETSCQVWHYCDLNGGKASFLCPNGTIFSQIALTCDWWFNVKCASTAQLYVLNERLYKYILPFTPKFPEDYSGPLVDKYLAMKFQEMEEKMRLEKEKALQEEAAENGQNLMETSNNSTEENLLDKTTTETMSLHSTSATPAEHKHESVNSQVSEQSSEKNLLIDDETDDISQRASVDTYETTTIANTLSTVKPKEMSYSLRPIFVSSTTEHDYGDYDSDKSHEENLLTKKTDWNRQYKSKKEAIANTSEQRVLPNTQETNMKITVEKVEVIEIKPDGETGKLIRNMILKSEEA